MMKQAPRRSYLVLVLALIAAVALFSAAAGGGPSLGKLAKQMKALQTQVAQIQKKRGPQGVQGPAGIPGAPYDSAQTVIKGGTCADIQAAIDQLPSSGGAVLVAAGTYPCDGPIVIDRDRVTLRGTGPATVLKLADDTNRPVLVLGQTTAVPTTTRRNIQIADLSIDGNRSQQQHECSNG